MNLKTTKLIISGLLFIFALASCKNEVDITTKKDIKDYSSVLSQKRIEFAKILNNTFSSKPEIAQITISECNKKFDGDADVLCKNLIKNKIIQNNNITTIEKVLNQQVTLSKVKSSVISSNFISDLVSQDSLLQVYFFRGNIEDSTSYKGIVVLPENYVEGDGKLLLVINKDGSTSYVRSDIDPVDNYLVISQNERMNYVSPTGIDVQKAPYVISDGGKPMKITRAKFTSISAKRSVEDWASGEPEVRLNVQYPLTNPATFKVEEIRNSTFLYPEKWIKHGLFKNDVKWNETLIDCPYWSETEMKSGWGRRLIWNEEDGASSSKDITNTFIEKTTNITTTLKTTIPASNGDKLCADSFIYYDEVGTGRSYTWSLLQFDVSCQ